MKTMKKVLTCCCYVCFMMFLLSQAAFAYLDPGTVTYAASMFLPVIFIVVVGIAVVAAIVLLIWLLTKSK